jgi:DNA-binding NarL/FixJ family response regulator
VTVATGDPKLRLSSDRNSDYQETHTCCGEFNIPPWVRDVNLSLLTEREHEVLAALGGCQSNTAIADRLCITERTVKKHLTSIFIKLEIASRTEAAVIAILRECSAECSAECPSGH